MTNEILSYAQNDSNINNHETGCLNLHLNVKQCYNRYLGLIRLHDVINLKENG